MQAIQRPTQAINKMHDQVIKVAIGEQKMEVTVKYNLDKRVMIFSEADDFKKSIMEKTSTLASQTSDRTSLISCSSARVRR